MTQPTSKHPRLPDPSQTLPVASSIPGSARQGLGWAAPHHLEAGSCSLNQKPVKRRTEWNLLQEDPVWAPATLHPQSEESISLASHLTWGVADSSDASKYTALSPSISASPL